MYALFIAAIEEKEERVIDVSCVTYNLFYNRPKINILNIFSKLT